MTMTADDATDAFESSRHDLLRLAYRMTGGRAEAEDIVQDAWLRWHRSDRAAVRNPRAWLSRIVANLCIDHLRKVQTRRETYIGPWLPEPIVTDPPSADDPGHAVELAQDVSYALMTLLETLKPEERAAFLLREAFDMPYGQLAQVLGKTQDACRQMVARARGRVRAGGARFAATDAEHEALLTAFAAAAQAGDAAALTQLLAPDALFTSDGGGKASAALRTIRGATDIAKLVIHTAGQARAPRGTVRRVRLNGRPGLVIADAGKVEVSTSIDVEAGRIAALYIMRNPDKLQRLIGPPLGSA